MVVLLIMCLIALSFAETAKDTKGAKATKDKKDDSEGKDDDHSHGHKPYERVSYFIPKI